MLEVLSRNNKKSSCIITVCGILSTMGKKANALSTQGIINDILRWILAFYLPVTGYAAYFEVCDPLGEATLSSTSQIIGQVRSRPVSLYM